MSRRSSLLLPSLVPPLLLTLLYSLFAAAQANPVDAEGHQWWQHAVFYEIYPRSFADSNNDGVGDLNGISSKMSYLYELGVDAIWITPCYPSPQVDFGYDVADYRNIDPMYGNLADFDHMVAEGKKHHVRVILDFVPNHTSDQHPWFQDSKSSRTAPHRIATGTSGATAKCPASLPTTGSQFLVARHGR
jgi:alpha-glucosidase